MSTTRKCAECRLAERESEPVVALVSRPNADHPNLRFREWVCDDHLQMLIDDYGDDVEVISEEGQMVPKHYCQRCGERLNPKRIVWLELSWRTNLYRAEPMTAHPAEDSQGWFAFGADCARQVLANGGRLERIR